MLLYKEIREALKEKPGMSLDEVAALFGVQKNELEFTYRYCRNHLVTSFDLTTQRMYKLSAKWASKQFNCTLKHIQTTCHGGCCRGEKNWPANSFPDNICGFLGEHGCVLELRDRPVSCMIFPMVLNDNGTIGLYQRMMFKTSICKDAFKTGPTLIEGQAFAFIEIFGEEAYLQAKSSVAKGEDYFFKPSKLIEYAFEHEVELDNAGLQPTPRSKLILPE